MYLLYLKFSLLLLLIKIPIVLSQRGGTSLMLIHNGDMHSKFEEYIEDENQLKIAGFGRTLHILNRFRREAREKNMKALYLNSGDTWAGSLWYLVHRWEIVADFMKLLKPDVISLGTHEFDEDLKNLSSYLKAVGCPVVCANADFTQEPELAKLIKPSHVIDINGLKVGIIGYLTPKVTKLGNTGKIKFTSEIPAIKREAKILANQGVKVLIALGHSGYDMDVEIAHNISDLKIIIGGYSHTLLWKGHQPADDVPEETYPMIVTSGFKRTFILHAGANTKYMGKLILYLNRQGIIQDYRDGSMYMSSFVPQDGRVLNLLQKYRSAVDSYKNTVIAKTSVYLSGHCDRNECNFGNMITDAFVDYLVTKKHIKSKEWSHVGIALLNGGAIRTCIERGNITIGQISNALPSHDRIISFSIMGLELLEFLEMSLRAQLSPLNGEFFQVSGLHVLIDAEIKIGNRIIFASARCTRCSIPKLKRVIETKTYRIVSTESILAGSYENNFLNSKAFDRVLEKVTDFQVVVNYLKLRKTIRPEVDERFIYVNAKNKKN